MERLLGRGGGFAELNAELCARIRSGVLTVESPGLMEVLRAMAQDQIAIDQPSYKPEGTPSPRS
jgi:hypothetical protein